MSPAPGEGDVTRVQRPPRRGGAAARRPQGPVARVRAAWRELFSEQRLAGIAALGLIGSMFLPWYTQTGIVPQGTGQQPVQNSLIAFQSWGFVEASILLVALAVLLLLFLRGERRAFHLPFGDGLVIAAGGAWVMFLVFYRQVDKPDAGVRGVVTGVSWGIFVAFLFGVLLTYAGWRVHARHRPEPRVDGDDPRTTVVEGDPTSVAGGEEITSVTAVATPDDAPTVAVPPDERPTRTLRRRQPGAVPRRGDGQFEGQLSFDDPDNQERLDT